MTHRILIVVIDRQKHYEVMKSWLLWVLILGRSAPGGYAASHKYTSASGCNQNLVCELVHSQPFLKKLLIVLGRLLGQGSDREEAAPSESTIMLVQATGGIIAGATASCITTPLDTIKTRLQVFLNLLTVYH